VWTRVVGVSTVVAGRACVLLGWFSLVFPVVSVHTGGVLVIVLQPRLLVVWVLWVWDV
jgi:hypothetical protein